MRPVQARITLIRHGQAHVNVLQRLGGPKGDTGLTDLGRQQAARLRDRLAATGELQPDVLFASSLPRAHETAEILAPALGLSPTIEPGLAEIFPGEADGMLMADFVAQYGQRPFDPALPISPGGESWIDFVPRVTATLAQIAEAHPDRWVVAVTHGWVIEAAFAFFAGLPTVQAPALGYQVSNTALTSWDFVPSARENSPLRWRLERYNDALHLHAAVRWSPSAEGADTPAVLP